MQAVAHNKEFAKKVGVPQSVGKEFTMKKMSMGGGVAPSKMGAVKTAAPSRDGVATKGKTKGTQIKMAKGGMAKMKMKKMAYGGKAC